MTVGGTMANGNGWVKSGNVTLTPKCTQGGALQTGMTYQYQKDGGAWVVMGTNLSLSTTAQSGTYRFRAVKTGILQTEIIDSEPVTINIDTTAPTLTVEALPTTTYKTSDGKNLYTNTLEVKATASDTLSGLESLEYSLNGTGYKPYTGSVVITEADAKNGMAVTFKATDKAGNSVTGKTETFFIDTSVPKAPTIKATLKDSSESYSNEWTGNDVIATVDTTAQTDAKTYEYQKPDGTWTPLNTNDGVTYGKEDSDSIDTFNCRGVGYNGLAGPVSSLEIKTMKTLPDLSLTVTPNLKDAKNNPVWVNTSVRFEAQTEKGVKLEYQEDSEKFKALGTGKKATLTADTEGKHKYTFKAINGVGGESTPITHEVWKDTTAPVQPSLTLGGTPNANGWYSEDLNLKVEATLVNDGSMSPEKVYYRLVKEGNEATAYKESPDASITLENPTDGTYTLEAYTKDQAGNTSDVVKQSFKKTSQAQEGDLVPTITLDGTKIPETNIYKGILNAKVGNPDVDPKTQNPLDRLEVQFVEAGEDLKTDGWRTYREGDTLSYENQKGTLYARALDVAGKTTPEQNYAKTEFTADSRILVITINSPAGVTESNWTAGPVTLSLEGGGTDKEGHVVLSGFDKYQVKKTDGSWNDLGGALDNGSITLTEKGKQTITLRAVSKAGIEGSEASFNLWIDNAGQPGDETFDIKVAVQKNGEAASPWFSKIVYIPEPAGTIPPSGLSYEYSEDGTHYKKLVGGSLTVDKETEETGKVYWFRGVSGTGAFSNTVQETAKIDAVAPAEPKLVVDTEGWRTTEVDAPSLNTAIEVKDPENTNMDEDGVNRSAVEPQLKITNRDTQQPVKDFGDSFDQKLKTGTYELTGRSTDKAANTSALTGVKVLKVDTDTPIIGDVDFKRINNDNLGRFLRSITFGMVANEAIEAEITATDKGSGPEDIYYQVVDEQSGAIKEEGQKKADGQGKIKLSLEPEAPQANVYIKTWAMDVAGNKGTELKSANALLEAQKPEAEIVLDAEETENGWYNKDLTYSLKVKDSDSGLAGVRVYDTDTAQSAITGLTPIFEKTLNGETTEEIIEDGLLTASTEGTHHLTLVVTDKAGNEKQVSQQVDIEKTIPVLTAKMYTYNESLEEPYASGNITGRDIYVSLSLNTDFLSGTNVLQVRSAKIENGSYGTWENISSPGQSIHKLMEEGNNWYEFRALSLAKNESISTKVNMVISRTLPKDPEIRVEQEGKDVNGLWTNTPPDVAIVAPSEADAAVRIRSDYVYKTSTNGAEVPEFSGRFKPETTDLKTGETIHITQLKDKAGNTGAVDIESEPYNPAEIPGAIVSFTPQETPKDDWYKGDPTNITVKAVVTGDVKYRPIEEDEDGNDMVTPNNQIDVIGYQINNEQEFRQSLSSQGLTEYSFDLPVSQQGKDLNLVVKVYDTWGNTTVNAYKLSHDSVAPAAPEVTLEDKTNQTVAPDGVVAVMK